MWPVSVLWIKHWHAVVNLCPPRRKSMRNQKYYFIALFSPQNHYISFDLTADCSVFLVQFLELIQDVQFYGYIRLDSCICDYPEGGCSADICVGSNEINCCIRLPNNQTKEVSLKIDRLRSWQVTFLVSTSLTLCIWIHLLFIKTKVVWEGQLWGGEGVVCFKSLPSAHIVLQTYPEMWQPQQQTI